MLIARLQGAARVALTGKRQPALGDGGREWVTQVDGREVRETREPTTDCRRRIKPAFCPLVPLEKYLQDIIP